MVRFPDQILEEDPGISWYELTDSVLLAVQSGVVINGAGAGPREAFRPRRLTMNDTDIAFGTQVYSFERCLTQIDRTLKLKLLPKGRRYCTSVKMLGLRNAIAGLQTRPTLPNQQQVMKLLCEHFATLGGDKKTKVGQSYHNKDR